MSKVENISATFVIDSCAALWKEAFISSYSMPLQALGKLYNAGIIEYTIDLHAQRLFSPEEFAMSNFRGGTSFLTAIPIGLQQEKRVINKLVKLSCN
jgi:hypothetical protein